MSRSSLNSLSHWRVKNSNYWSPSLIKNSFESKELKFKSMMEARDEKVEWLNTSYLSINLVEADVNMRKENELSKEWEIKLADAKKIHLKRVNIKRFGMSSITEYYTFAVKIRQTIFLQLVCTYFTISNNTKTSPACHYSSFFLQHCAMFIDGFIIRLVFNKSFATRIGFSRRFIRAAISFRTNNNHLSTSKIFFQKSKCPLIEFPMLLTTVYGKKLSCSSALKSTLQSFSRFICHISLISGLTSSSTLFSLRAI